MPFSFLGQASIGMCDRLCSVRMPDISTGSLGGHVLYTLKENTHTHTHTHNRVSVPLPPFSWPDRDGA